MNLTDLERELDAACSGKSLDKMLHLSRTLSRKPEDATDHDCRCPHCGYVDVVDAFDVLGADDGHIFCTICSTEFPIAWVDDDRPLFKGKP